MLKELVLLMAIAIFLFSVLFGIRSFVGFAREGHAGLTVAQARELSRQGYEKSVKRELRKTEEQIRDAAHIGRNIVFFDIDPRFMCRVASDLLSRGYAVYLGADRWNEIEKSAFSISWY